MNLCKRPLTRKRSMVFFCPHLSFYNYHIDVTLCDACIKTFLIRKQRPPPKCFHIYRHYPSLCPFLFWLVHMEVYTDQDRK